MNGFQSCDHTGCDGEYPNLSTLRFKKLSELPVGAKIAVGVLIYMFFKESK